MSFPKPEEKYADRASLNNFALISILRLVDEARRQLAITATPGDAGFSAQMALVDLDVAWASLPNRVREHFPQRPSLDFGEFHRGWHEKNGGADDCDDGCRFWVVSKYVPKIAADYVTALDEAGLYISTSKQRQSLKDFPGLETKEEAEPEDDGDHTPVPPEG